MVRVALVGLLLVVGGVGACAGKTVEADDGEVTAGGKPSKPPTQTSPVTQCKSLASTWCGQAFGCYVKVGRLAESAKKSNVDQCVKLFVDHAPCAEVTSVGADYGSCISQIKAMACSKWDVPTEKFGTIAEPPSCETALAFD